MSDRPHVLYDLCAGMSALTRAGVGGLTPRGVPALRLVAWTGSKDRYVRQVHALLGVCPDPSWRYVVVDPGMPGEVWRTVLDPVRRRLVVGLLDAWASTAPTLLWQQLREAGRPADDIRRVAAWLWLQARSITGAPVWWRHGGAGNLQSDLRSDRSGHDGRHGEGTARPRSAEAGELVQACTRGLLPERADLVQDYHGAARGAVERQAPTRKGGGGMHSSAAVARRLEALGAACDRSNVTVKLCRAEEVVPLPGYVVIDPNYQGATRYEHDMPRRAVIQTALRCRAAGARVLAHERAAIPELAAVGWTAHELTLPGGKPEWAMLSPAGASVPGA